MAESDYDFDENDDSVDDGEDDVTPEVDDEVVSPEVVAKARDEVLTAESLSPSAKENLRRQLEEEMERFLASGGRIREVPPDPDAV